MLLDDGRDAPPSESTPLYVEPPSLQSPQTKRTSAYPVWLWPNLVGLDAPVVAVLWQRFLGDAFGVSVPPVASAALGLVVWSIYLADRWLDARPGRPQESAPRHRFAAGNRVSIGVAAIMVAGAALAMAPFLPIHYVLNAAAVAIALAAYLTAVHAIGARGLGELTKALLVGLIFAAGAAVPLAADRPDIAVAWLPAVGAFASTCWLNCRLIAGWEASVRVRHLAGWVAALLAIFLGVRSPRPVALAVAGAVGLLAVLHVMRARVPVELRRVLADVAMLTPLAFGEWA
jgi:hypothetical protein